MSEPPAKQRDQNLGLLLTLFALSICFFVTHPKRDYAIARLRGCHVLSGKSAYLHLWNGAVKPDNGCIFVSKEEVAHFLKRENSFSASW